MSDRDGKGRAPRLWQALLGRLLPREQREAGLGDAAEEFHRRARTQGVARARAWYCRQALRSIPPAAGRWIGAAVESWGDEHGEGEKMNAWIQDLRWALRAIRRRPGFSGTVLVTLALGVGATTALFGVFRAVFLEPVPLPDSDELVVVMEEASFGCCGPASGPDYLDWRERNRSFEGMAALSPGTYTLSALDEPERVEGMRVTASAFELLGVAPQMGRFLLPADQEAPGTVLLTHELWQAALGGRPEVVGSSLELDGATYTVAGVMPPGFDVPSPWAHHGRHKLFLPFQNEALQGNRGSHGFPVIARLAEGVDKAAAQADMTRVMAELAQEYPDTNAERTATVFTVHEYLFGDVGKQLGLILGAAGLVLLIACGNLAGLLLARAAGRETELAVRTALGASRRALVRMLFAESLVLTVLGGALAVLVSVVAVDGFKAVLPANIPRVGQVGIDGWALLFAAGATAFTAVAFGMLPAVLASRTELAASVKEGGYGTVAPAKERLQNAFIVGQIALGLVLANGAGLLVQSYAALRGQEFGFRAEGVLTMSLSPAGARYEEPQAVRDYYDRVLARVAALPGVALVGTISRLPFYGGTNGNVWVEGSPPRTSGDQGPLVEVTSITGDYFEAMGIELLRGRRLRPEDADSLDTGVVVNEQLAREAWPDENPLGKRFSFSDAPPRWLTVVGVVKDVRQWGPEQPPVGQAYFPLERGWGAAGGYLIVRTQGDPSRLAGPVREGVVAVDPSQPPSAARTMESYVEGRFAQRRFYTTLIALFAIAALLLAAAGVYGTVSYFVTRRLRDLGIRMALGAGATGIVGLVLKRGARLAIWGVALGLAGVWASTAAVGALVYCVAPMEPLTLMGGTAVLVAVALAASVFPAARAVRVDPVLALRAE